MRVLRDPTSGRVKRGSAGAILRAVAGEAETCPCCGGGGCACENGTALDACCCLGPGEPGYCGDDLARCQAPCEVDGPCECGSSGAGVSLDACCCLPVDNPASCAGDPARCIDPCDTKNGCTDCACCSQSCGYDLGAWSSTFGGVSNGYHDGGACTQLRFETSVSVVCSGVINGCTNWTGTCTLSGTLKEWNAGGTLVSHWNGVYSTAATGCATSFITDSAGWLVGPSPAGARIVRMTDCQTLDRDICQLRGAGYGGLYPCWQCVRSSTCTRPDCAPSMAGMGAAMSLRHEIAASGLLTPIRAVMMARLVDPSRCPVCDRKGWDGVWRAMEGPGGLRMSGRTRSRPMAVHGMERGAPVIIDDAEAGADLAWMGRSRGLGDTVAKVIDRATFGRVKKTEGCGCAKRQEWLNRVVPYGEKAPGTGHRAPVKRGRREAPGTGHR